MPHVLIITLGLAVLGGVGCSIGDHELMRVGNAAEWSDFQPTDGRPATDSGWRRTSQGWIKVGPLGAAGLLPSPSSPTSIDPPLHPGVLAMFLALASVLGLVLFEGRGQQMGKGDRGVDCIQH